ncbi:hypothetical protein FGG08_003805 [Glutinoglossum americanum]|uniref:Uncharacterized protein n=1 Tax=Glutinoglossum americanum TaxID=1670608 RepID=A0A9P8IAB8_9PEZI|nr:hypothetical protein FGG08_003805 [Glutinoglossum americanum]
MAAHVTSLPPASTFSTPAVIVPAVAVTRTAPTERTKRAERSTALNLPTVQADSPATLAARAEQLPEKLSSALVTLAHMPKLRGVYLRSGRTIVWEQKVNSRDLAAIVIMIVEVLNAHFGLLLRQLADVCGEMADEMEEEEMEIIEVEDDSENEMEE